MSELDQRSKQPVTNTNVSIHRPWPPSPIDTIERSSASKSARQAYALRGLINGCLAKRCDSEGRYRGYPEKITVSDIEKHLNGVLILGFTVCPPRKNRLSDPYFIGFDIDAHFLERLPAFALVINRLGISSSAFATIAPGRTRGKIVIPLAKNIRRRRAIQLAKYILAEAALVEGFGELFAQDIEIRPTLGDGGVLRILGRSPREVGSIEYPANLNGERINLDTVVPLSARKIRSLTIALGLPLPSAGYSRRIESLLDKPWSYSTHGGSDGIFSRVLDLAREVLRVNGKHEGFAKFKLLIRQIKDRSPELDSLSPTTNDKRNPLDWRRAPRTAWKLALRKPFGWERPELDQTVTKATIRAVEALTNIVRSRGLMTRCFALSTRDLADHAGVAQQTACRWIKVAAEAGALVIHDKGISGIEYGSPMILGLVCKGQSVEDVLASASRDELLIARRLQRTRSQTSVPNFVGRLDA